MSKLKFILSHHKEDYVAVVESLSGLIANTVPSVSKKIHREFLLKMGSILNITNMKIIDTKSIYTDFLFEMNTNPKMARQLSNNLPIDFQLYSKKQQIVAETLQKIQPGKIVSYGKLAELSGIPRGARFVGNCMSSNYMPLLIPCHRVVKADHSLGNYSAGGPDVKFRLLKLEGVNLK